MYKAEPDPYCYPGTTVLINRLGTRDQAELDAFEAEMSSDRASRNGGLPMFWRPVPRALGEGEEVAARLSFRSSMIGP